MSEHFIAEVGEVTDTGLTLILAGEATPTEKKYKCNTSVIFKAGDRVLVHEVADSYVVDYVIGEPSEGGGGGIPAGGKDGQALLKDGDTDYTVKWGDPPSPSKLVAGAYSVTLSTGSLAPNSNISAGTSLHPFSGLYANGEIKLCQGTTSNNLYLGASAAKIGFFGKTPIAQPSVASTATVATVITQLKNLGLFK